MTTTRQQRRRIKANAPAIARELATSCYDYADSGKLVRVDHPEAVKALQRAFLHMLRNGLEPHVTRISAQTASVFPRGHFKDQGLPADAASYLAVGMDRENRGTYSLRQIHTPHAPPQLAEMANRSKALTCLQPHTETRGFPIVPLLSTETGHC